MSSEQATVSSEQIESVLKEVARIETDNNRLVERIGELKHKISALKTEKQIIQNELEQSQGKHSSVASAASIYAECPSDASFEGESEL